MMGAVIVSYGGHALGAASCKKLLAKNWTLSFDLRAQAREVLTKTNFGQKKAFDNGADILPMVASNQGTEENLDDLWDVKVRAPFRIIKAVPPHLKAKGKKRMVKIGSIYGKRFQKISICYAMTRQPVLALTKVLLTVEWCDSLHATALCPRAIDTELITGTQSRPHAL